MSCRHEIQLVRARNNLRGAGKEGGSGAQKGWREWLQGMKRLESTLE